MIVPSKREIPQWIRRLPHPMQNQATPLLKRARDTLANLLLPIRKNPVHLPPNPVIPILREQQLEGTSSGQLVLGPHLGRLTRNGDRGIPDPYRRPSKSVHRHVAEHLERWPTGPLERQRTSASSLSPRLSPGEALFLQLRHELAQALPGLRCERHRQLEEVDEDALEIRILCLRVLEHDHQGANAC